MFLIARLSLFNKVFIYLYLSIYNTGALKPFAYHPIFKKVRLRNTIHSSQYRITAEHVGSFVRVD
jgi:hypothetical protein